MRRAQVSLEGARMMTFVSAGRKQGVTAGALATLEDYGGPLKMEASLSSTKREKGLRF